MPTTRSAAAKRGAAVPRAPAKLPAARKKGKKQQPRAGGRFTRANPQDDDNHAENNLDQVLPDDSQAGGLEEDPAPRSPLPASPSPPPRSPLPRASPSPPPRSPLLRASPSPPPRSPLPRASPSPPPRSPLPRASPTPPPAYATIAPGPVIIDPVPHLDLRMMQPGYRGYRAPSEAPRAAVPHGRVPSADFNDALHETNENQDGPATWGDDEDENFPARVKREPVDDEDEDMDIDARFHHYSSPHPMEYEQAEYEQSPPHQSHHSQSRSHSVHSNRPESHERRSPHRSHSADARSVRTRSVSPLPERESRRGRPSHSPRHSPRAASESAHSAPRSRGRTPQRTRVSPAGLVRNNPERAASADSLLLSPRITRSRSHTAARRPNPNSPLPPSSPEPPIESDAEDSGDDYAAVKAKERRILDKRARQGYTNPPDTEEEDLDDEDEFIADVTQNGFDDGDANAGKKKQATKQRKVAKKRGNAKAKGKGKGKVKDTEPETGGDEGDVLGVEGSDEEEEGEDRGKHKAGPVPKEIHELLIKAQDTFNKTVNTLAKQCGKSPSTLHQLLGTTPKRTRATSPWNMWQMWYAEKHPMDKTKMTLQEYNVQSRQAFKAACPNLPEDRLSDADAVFAAIPWLREWHEETMVNAVAIWRDTGKIKREVQKDSSALTDVSRYLYNNYKVHAWGYVIDPQGQASFSWGGTDQFKIVRTEYKLPLTQTIKDLEHMFAMVEMRERGEAAAQAAGSHLLPKVFEQHQGEEARDSYRRKFSAIMATQMFDHCLAAGTVVSIKRDKFKMQWQDKFCDLAFQNQFRLIHYPRALEDIQQIIGSSFDLKKVGVAQYKKFMPSLEKANDPRTAREENDESDDEELEPAMEIVAWSHEEKALPLAEQRELALVITTEGRALRRVRHSTAYNSSLAKASQMRTKDKKRTTKNARAPSPVQSQDLRGRSVSRGRRMSLSASPERRGDHYSRGRSPAASMGPDVRPTRPLPLHAARNPSPPRVRQASPPRGSRQPSGPHGARRASPPRVHRQPSPSYSARRPSVPRRSGHHSPPREASPPRKRHQPSPSRTTRPPSPPRARRPPSLPRNSRHQSPARAGPSRRQDDAPHAGSSRTVPPPRHSRDEALARRMQLGVRSSHTEEAERPAKRRKMEAGGSAADNVAPPAPVYTGARDLKRKRVEEMFTADDDRPSSSQWIRLRFNIGSSESLTSRIFYATGWENVSAPTRADRYTLYWDEERRGWTRMAKGRTPVLAREEDRACYQQEIQRHGLYDHQ
ncbi:hypothetical protein B0H11DRAFT_1899676 [Mycena galericulata]|nr:hypothetical protein B0H11DRAFT_1899676 [Mycena galericulata]